RAAVLLERGRVEHAIADRLALLALEDTLADFLGVKLSSPHSARPAACHTTPDSAPCSPAAGHRYHGDSHPARSPTTRRRTARPNPSRRIGTAASRSGWQTAGPRAARYPSNQRTPHGDRPVTIEPSTHQLLAARRP